MSEPTLPRRVTPQAASESAAPLESAAQTAVAGMSFDQVVALARTGMVRCPGANLTEDSIFLAGLLAEAGIGSVVITRRHDVLATAADANTGGTADPTPPGTACRSLLSRQTDLPHELASLSDDCCLIAGPMMVWRSDDHLVVALHEHR